MYVQRYVHVSTYFYPFVSLDSPLSHPQHIWNRPQNNPTLILDQPQIGPKPTVHQPEINPKLFQQTSINTKTTPVETNPQQAWKQHPNHSKPILNRLQTNPANFLPTRDLRSKMLQVQSKINDVYSNMQQISRKVYILKNTKRTLKRTRGCTHLRSITAHLHWYEIEYLFAGKTCQKYMECQISIPVAVGCLVSGLQGWANQSLNPGMLGIFDGTHIQLK